jgi:hypothetical protein
MEFKKAVKTKSRLRLAIDGISGSGKTYTALAIASGMGDAVALIDTEHGSASLYADRFDFDTVDLMEFQIENYIEALNAAAAAQYPVVIIDSTSHAWDALVERVERIARQSYGGNTFRGWGEGTPLQKKLIEAMLNYPGHVIVTCRSKTEYSVDKDDKGKTAIKKVGTAAVQRQGFEYEFTMAMTMDANHVGFVTKDRTGKFQDKFIEKPGKKFGEELVAWLNEGAEPPPENKPSPPPNTPPDASPLVAQRKEAGEKLVAVMIEKDPDELDYFTDEEKKSVKDILKKCGAQQQGIAIVEGLIQKWGEELEKRKAAFKPIPFAEDIPPVEPEGDNFTDDIPWGDEPPQAANRPLANQSWAKAFQNQINKEADQTFEAVKNGNINSLEKDMVQQ